MNTKKKVVIITNFPSYHNVDLFNKFIIDDEIQLKVYYLISLPEGRQWSKLREIYHSHEFIKPVYLTKLIYVNPGLIKKVWNENPDLLIITQYANIEMQLLMYIWGILGKKWVFWSEAPNVRFSENKIIKSDFFRMILRRISLIPISVFAKQIWCIGDMAKKAYEKISCAECTNFPYFFNQDPFSRIIRNEVSNPKVVFLFSGKLIYRKGIDLLLQAIELLAKKRDDFELIILGNGPLRYLENDLSLDVKEKINWLGFFELDEIPSVYANCDVLVFPSRYDGWGMTVVEGMAAGMPVVVSDGMVGASEAINDGENGFLFTSNNVVSLYNRLEFFLNNKDRIYDMGTMARKAVTKYSDWQGANILKGLITRIIDK